MTDDDEWPLSVSSKILVLASIVLFAIVAALWGSFIKELARWRASVDTKRQEHKSFISDCISRHPIYQCEAFWTYERRDLSRRKP